MMVTSRNLLDLVHRVLMEGNGNRFRGESDRITGYWVFEALEEAHSGAIISHCSPRPLRCIDHRWLGASWRSWRV